MDNPFALIFQQLEAIDAKIDSLQSTPREKEQVEIIDRAELCKRLGITVPTCRKMEKKKQIPLIRCGDSLRYDWFKVLKKLEQK